MSAFLNSGGCLGGRQYETPEIYGAYMKSLFRQSAPQTFLLLLLLIVSCLTLPVARAQFLDQGGFTGAVQDPSGAVIPGAEVTLTNPETAFSQTTKSNASGVYVFSPLKI